MSTILSLNCLFLGDEPVRSFSIKISSTATFSMLKDAIKVKQHPKFEYMAADDFDLWKVPIPLESDRFVDRAALHVATEPALLPVLRLSDVFTASFDRKCIHLIVRLPQTSTPPLPNPFLTPDLDIQRTQFLQARPSEAPSSSGRYLRFSKDQLKHNAEIYCNRPPDVSNPIPVTLFNGVFGEFVDNCQKHIPTAQDNQLVLDLSRAMSEFYSSEKGRSHAVLTVLADHGIHVAATKISGTEYMTDGDILYKGHRIAIFEFKNEVGDSGAEPYLRSICCYLEATRHRMHEFKNSSLPCMIILIFGSYIAFAGAAWSGHPNIQMFSMLPLNFHHTDIALRTTAARHLGAFRHSLKSLEAYYEHELRRLDSRRNPLFPYPMVFSPLAGGTERWFDYELALFDKLLFRGRLRDSGDKICIKFVQRYSQDAHKHCASKGHAPGLLGFKELPGGWFMVVMDLIGDEYTRLRDSQDFKDIDTRGALRDEVKKSIIDLHQAGFVHGDLRDTNIMVAKKDGNVHFMLVDFDWSGPCGEVQYPINVNKVDIWRPEGADDGELITADHDIQMLDHM